MGGKYAVACKSSKNQLLTLYNCMCTHAGLRERHPELWQDFSQLARGKQQLSPYWDAVAALDQAPRVASAASTFEPKGQEASAPGLSVSTFLPSRLSR